MEEISATLSRTFGEALSYVDASTLVFLIVANLVQLAIILFLVIVTPVWIIRHYNARKDDAVILANHQKTALEELERTAERMEPGMTAIETILDADSPNWKERM